MKLTALNCPTCGAKLEIEPGRSEVFCSYCGTQIHVDDEVQRVEHTVQYSNAEDAGYQFEKGRQRAMAEAPSQVVVQQVKEPQKKTSIVVWVLGWIFIFPVPLTIIMLRKKNLKPEIRYAIIVVAWLVYFAWIGSSRSSEKNKVEDTSSEVVATQSKDEEKTEKAKKDKKAEKEEPAEKEETEAEDSDAIVLEAGVHNDYSSTLIINEGTEFEQVRVIFDVPAGTYDAKNIGRYMAQVNVYSHEEVQQGEWMEPADGTATLIDAGKTKEITVPEGYYIYLVEPDRIELTAK